MSLARVCIWLARMLENGFIAWSAWADWGNTDTWRLAILHPMLSATSIRSLCTPSLCTPHGLHVHHMIFMYTTWSLCTPHDLYVHHTIIKTSTYHAYICYILCDGARKTWLRYKTLNSNPLHLWMLPKQQFSFWLFQNHVFTSYSSVIQVAFFFNIFAPEPKNSSSCLCISCQFFMDLALLLFYRHRPST